MSLEKFLPEMERCSNCSYCKWIPLDKIQSHRFAYGCPSIAYNNFNSYSARGRYAMGRSLLNGQSEYTEQVKDTVFQCLSCGSCDVSCKVCRYNMEPLQMMHALRGQLVQDGQVLPAHQQYIDSLAAENNMRLGDKAQRGQWAEGLGIKVISESQPAEVLFHAGCSFSYDPGLRDAVRDAVMVLKEAGVDVGILGAGEMCCGGRAYQMGFDDAFSQAANKVIETWRRLGIKTVVTPCADCYYAFKRLYPAIGAEFEILHTVEYFERLIKEGRIQFKSSLPLKVTYHDPCHLGRLGEPYEAWDGKEIKLRNQIVTYDPPKPRNNGAQGVYDAPRAVLESIPGVELAEMERIREYAWCCGAGGGAKEAYPEFAGWTAGERLEEAEATGAEVLVSACGSCERSFMDAAGDKLKVLDIAQLVRRAMTEGVV